MICFINLPTISRRKVVTPPPACRDALLVTASQCKREGFFSQMGTSPRKISDGVKRKQPFAIGQKAGLLIPLNTFGGTTILRFFRVWKSQKGRFMTLANLCQSLREKKFRGGSKVPWWELSGIYGLYSPRALENTSKNTMGIPWYTPCVAAAAGACQRDAGWTPWRGGHPGGDSRRKGPLA